MFWRGWLFLPPLPWAIRIIWPPPPPCCSRQSGRGDPDAAASSLPPTWLSRLRAFPGRSGALGGSPWGTAGRAEVAFLVRAPARARPPSWCLCACRSLQFWRGHGGLHSPRRSHRHPVGYRRHDDPHRVRQGEAFGAWGRGCLGSSGAFRIGRRLLRASSRATAPAGFRTAWGGR